MTDFKGFQGAAKKLDDIDLPRIGHEIGVGEDELHAFMDVESAGSGFDKKKRPKMLFEPHVFFRNLSGKRRDEAVAAGLAYRKWKPGNYPRDSYPRLEKAMLIDERAALLACSWGALQVLGENHKMVGYTRVQDFVLAMMADEDNHIEAMVEYVISAGIDDEMRDLAALTRPTRPSDCVGIVSVYNGPGYKKNNYHVNFANAHNKWRGIKDTPWTPEMDEEPPALAPAVTRAIPSNPVSAAPVPPRRPEKTVTTATGVGAAAVGGAAVAVTSGDMQLGVGLVVFAIAVVAVGLVAYRIIKRRRSK